MTWVERLVLYVVALAVGLGVVVVERWLGLEATLIMAAVAGVVIVAASTEVGPRAEEPVSGGEAGSSMGGVRLMGDRRRSRAARAGSDES